MKQEVLKKLTILADRDLFPALRSAYMTLTATVAQAIALDRRELAGARTASATVSSIGSVFEAVEIKGQIIVDEVTRLMAVIDERFEALRKCENTPRKMLGYAGSWERQLVKLDDVIGSVQRLADQPEWKGKASQAHLAAIPKQLEAMTNLRDLTETARESLILVGAIQANIFDACGLIFTQVIERIKGHQSVAPLAFFGRAAACVTLLRTTDEMLEKWMSGEGTWSPSAKQIADGISSAAPPAVWPRSTGSDGKGKDQGNSEGRGHGKDWGTTVEDEGEAVANMGPDAGEDSHDGEGADDQPGNGHDKGDDHPGNGHDKGDDHPGRGHDKGDDHPGQGNDKGDDHPGQGNDKGGGSEGGVDGESADVEATEGFEAIDLVEELDLDESMDELDSVVGELGEAIDDLGNAMDDFGDAMGELDDFGDELADPPAEPEAAPPAAGEPVAPPAASEPVVPQAESEPVVPPSASEPVAHPTPSVETVPDVVVEPTPVPEKSPELALGSSSEPAPTPMEIVSDFSPGSGSLATHQLFPTVAEMGEPAPQPGTGELGGADTTFDLRKAAMLQPEGLENVDVARGADAWDRLYMQRTQVE